MISKLLSGALLTLAHVRILGLIFAATMLVACTGFSGAGLQPGVATEADVVQTMGAPAMYWSLPDGGKQLSYPRGPYGNATFMAYIDPVGQLERIENVLQMTHFARIQAGMTQDQVLQVLGPPQPEWTAYFKARNELVWEWRYCDSWHEAARFDVLFDGTSRRVRSTMTWTEGSRSNFPIGC